MLRTIFVLILINIGTYYALHNSFYAILFYLWYAYFRPEDWIWADFLRNISLSYIIGCYVLISAIFSRQRFIVNNYTSIIFIFLIHTYLSALFSEHSSYSWLYWKDFFKSTLITYMIIVLVDDFRKFRLTILVIVLSLGFEGAKQGWFYLVTSPGWANPNPIAFLGDNNGVAVGMLMLVPMIVLLAQTTTKRAGRPFYWFLMLGVLYRALSTHSRGGFLACLAMAGVCWLYSRHKVQSLLVGGVVVIVLFTTLPDNFWSRVQTIQTYEEQGETSALSRLHFWRVALDMAKAHPFFGVGYNAYNLSYDDYDFSNGQYGRQRAVHNSLFAVVAELGYVGLVLYLLIFLSALRTCYRLYRLDNDHPSLPLHESAAALSTSLIVFLVGGFFLSFQYQEMLWHYLGLTFALAEIAKRDRTYGDDLPASKDVLEPVRSSTTDWDVKS